MAKLTFGQEAIQNIINQGRIEAGITNIQGQLCQVLKYLLG
jgi:hypothetical protein